MFRSDIMLLTVVMLCAFTTGNAQDEEPIKVIAERNWLQSGITVIPPKTRGGGRDNAPAKLRLRNVVWNSDVCGDQAHLDKLQLLVQPPATVKDLATKCLTLTWEASHAGQVVTLPPEQMQITDVQLVSGAGRRMILQTCQILNLNLGPLDLNLLGLQVHLEKVVLDVTAVGGANNLLGNLLCAVANLLTPGGILVNLLQGVLNAITNLLNGLNLG